MAEDTEGAAFVAYRKKRVKRIKRIIIATIIFLLLFPTILSVILMFKISSLEHQIEVLSDNRQQQVQQKEQDIVQAKEKKEIKETPEPARKKVYLTFDDGPGKQTKKILDVLKKEKVKATFFVVGKEGQYAKKLYRRIVKEGHTLGMHSYSHISDSIYESKKSFTKDLEQIYKQLYQITGQQPVFYRFPGGSSTQSTSIPIQTFTKVLQEKNITYIDWNVISPDINTPTVSKRDMVNSIVENVSQFESSVVLLYDSEEHPLTVKALPDLIKSLKDKNYELLPLDNNTPLIRHNR